MTLAQPRFDHQLSSLDTLNKDFSGKSDRARQPLGQDEACHCSALILCSVSYTSIFRLGAAGILFVGCASYGSMFCWCFQVWGFVIAVFECPFPDGISRGWCWGSWWIEWGLVCVLIIGLSGDFLTGGDFNGWLPPCPKAKFVLGKEFEGFDRLLFFSSFFS